MNNNSKDQIKQPLGVATKLLWIGIPLCLLTPIVFTQLGCLIDFSQTGSVGDTIGGITSPFINIIGAILVFLALKSQIQANLSLQDQVDRQDRERRLDIENRQLNQLYDNLKSSIDNFSYTTLDRWELGNNDQEKLTGSEALYKLFQDFYCDFHADEAEMKCNPKITEVISMLEICNALLIKIKESRIPDKETLWTLASHQFLYRIFPRVRSDYPSNLQIYYCDSCGKNHGLPKEMCDLFESIYNMIDEKEQIGKC